MKFLSNILSSLLAIILAINDQLQRYGIPIINHQHSIIIIGKDKRSNISICLLLFMFIICFSIIMLLITQQMLLSTTTSSTSTTDQTNESDSSNGNGIDHHHHYHLFYNIKLTNNGGHQYFSLKNFLSNFNETYKIDDNIFSLDNLNCHLKYFDNSSDDQPSNATHDDNDDENDFWQPVCSSNNKFYVFSAYIDQYNRSNLNLNFFNTDYQHQHHNDNQDYFVRIIAVTTLTSKDKIICSYSLDEEKEDDNGRKQIIQKNWFRQGKMKPIREHWNLQYSAFFIYCPLPKMIMINTLNNNDGHSSTMLMKSNYYLSIIALSKHWYISNNNDDDDDDLELNRLLKQYAQTMKMIVPSNRMPIHGLQQQQRQQNNDKLAVCIKPLHYYYNKTINLIEFIELNRILGVRRFYFFNHTVSTEVDQILRLYQQYEPELLKILQWKLPIRSQLEIRTEGIFAALNDCLYRARYNRFRYVMFIDLDEFIIPNNHKNLIDLIENVEHFYPDKIGALSFRNGFFYLQYPNDQQIEKLITNNDDKTNLHKQLITLTKTWRKSELNIHKQRSKCIVLVDNIIEMGNHFVWEFLYGKHIFNIDPKLAYLHHYRVCEFGGNNCIENNDHIIDRRIYYWSKSLLNNIHYRLQLFCDSIRIQQTSIMNDICNFI